MHACYNTLCLDRSISKEKKGKEVNSNEKILFCLDKKLGGRRT